MKLQKSISFDCKLVCFLAACIGVWSSIYTDANFMGKDALKFFTIQSNIWIGIVCLIGLILYIIENVKKKEIIKHWMYVVKLVFTISITLTGFVFCFVLAPTMAGAFSFSNILTHVVVPLSALVDFFVFPMKEKYKKIDFIHCAYPPIYYLFFVIICYNNGSTFMGSKVPYFFLNWDSEAGIWGFSSELPYLGVAYWIVLIALFVLGLGSLFGFLKNLIVKKVNKIS